VFGIVAFLLAGVQARDVAGLLRSGATITKLVARAAVESRRRRERRFPYALVIVDLHSVQ